MNIAEKLLTVSSNNKTVGENAPKVYEAGKISALKVPASSNSGILTDCLEAPLISLYAEVVNEYSREIVLTSETGEMQSVIINLYGNVYTIELRSDGTVWFEENIGSGIIDFVDYTNTEVGQALKSLHTYEGTTYVSGAHSVGYYKDIRLTQYEAGKKEEKEKIDYHLKRSKKAVLMRGGEIDMNAEIDELPDAILNIPIDASLGFYDDSEIAYQKTVPEGAEDYALLKQLGGMTYKCNNLIPFPYIHNGKAIEVDYTETIKGITYTVMSGGGIHVEGTSTGDNSFYIASKNIPFPIKTDMCLSGGLSQGTSSLISVILRKLKSDNTDQLYLSATSDYKTGQLQEGESIYSVGIFIASGKTVDNVIYPMLNYGTIPKPYEPYYEGLRDTKVTDIVSKGENLEPITYPLPEAVQLKAVNDTYYDYIEFDNGRVFGYKVTEEIVLNGSETWVGNGVSGVKNNYFVTKTSTEQGKYVDRNAISDRYDYNKLSSSNAGVGIDAYWSNAFNGFVIGIRPPNETSYTVTSFEKELKNNPVTARVALAEPIVTDITDLFTNFDNFIKVEGGGSIEFVNDYKNAVPSTIKYTVKVGA